MSFPSPSPGSRVGWNTPKPLHIWRSSLEETVMIRKDISWSPPSLKPPTHRRKSWMRYKNCCLHNGSRVYLVFHRSGLQPHTHRIRALNGWTLVCLDKPVSSILPYLTLIFTIRWSHLTRLPPAVTRMSDLDIENIPNQLFAYN